MKPNRMLVFVMVVTLAAVVLSACGSAAAFPTGKFVSETDQSYGWQFNADGSWQYFSPSGLPIEGTYKVAGSTYTETDSSTMPADGVNCSTEGAYSWSFDGSKLSFKVSSDKCQERIDMYTRSAWVPTK